jgi:transposase
MIGSTRNIRVYAAARPVSMNKGIDGLALIVRAELGRDPMSGDLFLFVGRDRRRAKVLYFDGTGMCVFYKRLDKGRFASVWHNERDRQIEMTSTELTLFIEGSSLVGRFPLSPPAINEKDIAIGIRV